MVWASWETGPPGPQGPQSPLGPPQEWHTEMVPEAFGSEFRCSDRNSSPWAFASLANTTGHQINQPANRGDFPLFQHASVAFSWFIGFVLSSFVSFFSSGLLLLVLFCSTRTRNGCSVVNGNNLCFLVTGVKLDPHVVLLCTGLLHSPQQKPESRPESRLKSSHCSWWWWNIWGRCLLLCLSGSSHLPAFRPCWIPEWAALIKACSRSPPSLLSLCCSLMQ